MIRIFSIKTTRYLYSVYAQHYINTKPIKQQFTVVWFNTSYRSSLRKLQLKNVRKSIGHFLVIYNCFSLIASCDH